VGCGEIFAARDEVLALLKPRHEAAKRIWRYTSNRVPWPDEKTYMSQIQPRLSSVTIAALSSALGICESYAADIRAGQRRPHPRHWKKLAEMPGRSRPTAVPEGAR
jgi:hypothetical protein